MGSDRRRLSPWLPLLLLAGGLAACASPVRRFPLAPALWDDPDRGAVAEKPATYFSGLYGDAIDQTLFRPVTDALAVPDTSESVNVNALDEVPDSSWFHNRIGAHPFAPEDAAAGACAEGPRLRPDHGPWTIVRAKASGVTPGFFVEAPDGQRYLLKLDGPLRPERASAADAVASRLYHAVGYPGPCNEVVFFPRDVLALAGDAVAEDGVGRERPLGAAQVATLLDSAVLLPDGRYRALASRFLPGEPIGPFRWRGTRPDDPNDVVPHEDRREIRALRLMAAWVGHFDVREQNSLDMWVEEDGRRFVRHYQLDFGDSFGSPWADTRLNRRIGHASYFDVGQILVDIVTLGAVPRPWYHRWEGRGAGIFRYYDAADFDPADWRPIYPNPAFARLTDRDALWLVRKLVHVSDEHIAAVVATARLSDPQAAAWLRRVLAARRDAIARHWLDRMSPLDQVLLTPPEAPGGPQRVCFADLAIRHAGRPPGEVRYRLRVLGGAELDQRLAWSAPRPARAGGETCLALRFGGERPADLAPAGTPDDHPLRYAVVEVYVQRRGEPRATRLDVHAYDRGPERGLALVGLRRAAEPVRLTDVFAP